MSRYLILIHGDDESFAALPPGEMQRMIESLQPFEAAVSSEGKLVATHRLMPASSAKLVRIRGNERSITDGPFTETKEQFGGYYLVEAQDEAQVMRWVELIPALMDSTLEIREVILEDREIIEEERSVP